MRNAKWLVGALGLAILTAGCTTDGGYYPSTAYNSGYYNNGYAYPNTAYRTGYYAPNVAAAPRSGSGWSSAHRDYDRDGIPNRYDRDANGDGVPDRYQGRYVR